MAAFDPATLERWRALAIVDRDGITVGTISEFYLDRETGYPSWALVETGLFGPTLTFVPLVHATEISDGLQVPYGKDHIKDSPRVDINDELTPEEEAALFAHYGVDYEPAAGAPAAPVAAGDGVPVPNEPPGPVAADPATVAEGEGGSAPAAATVALDVEHEPAEADGGHHHPGPAADTVTAGVPDEPGTTEPDQASRTDQDGIGPEGPTRDAAGSGMEVGSGVERPVGPTDLDRDRHQVAPTDPDSDRLGDGLADPDLGRTAPVEPGLPGSTAASSYGATATVDKGAAPSGHPADEPLQAPDEPGWAPGAAGSFEEPVPVDPPAGASDRWREAKLAAERDRIARAAAQPEERSPLERARRRLERLVGVGQEPADHDEMSPADREAAERARRARLGLDEEDQPRR